MKKYDKASKASKNFFSKILKFLSFKLWLFPAKRRTFILATEISFQKFPTEIQEFYSVVDIFEQKLIIFHLKSSFPSKITILKYISTPEIHVCTCTLIRVRRTRGNCHAISLDEPLK